VTDLTTAEGCGYCGLEARDHLGQRWVKEVGYHEWTPSGSKPGQSADARQVRDEGDEVSNYEWATRVLYADGPPEVAPVDGEGTARWAYDLMSTSRFPRVVASGRVATAVELVVRVRDGDGEWQVTE
jgi:hypothetical protein